MQSRSSAMVLALGLALLVASPVSVAGAGVSPVQKVIQLMEGMLAKGQEEKLKEQDQFAVYKRFCDDTSAEKRRTISEASEQIETSTADIQKYTAKAEKLGKEVASLEEDVSVWTGDKRAATKVRELEKADFDAMFKDYSESITALEKAISVLKKQLAKAQAKADAADSFVQLDSLRSLRLIPDDAKQAIASFLQQQQQHHTEADAAQQAVAYLAGQDEPGLQSHGVVDMLDKLYDKFLKQRNDLDKKEMNSKHAYQMLMQDLTAQLEESNEDIREKSESKAKALQAKASSNGDLEDATTTQAMDEKYLEDLVATCEEKANDFVSRQKLRTEELEALTKATEIISSGAVKGSSEKHLHFSQLASGQALVSLRAEATSALNRVAEMLHRRAKELDSRVLSALAERVALGADPFAKVKNMVKDLITRLVDQANEEAEHKEWCDKELPANEKTRKKKTEQTETLTAEIDQLTASIAKLTEDINELSDAVAELDKAMVKATQIRDAEKKKNKEAIDDARVAQKAVAQALVVLRDFYSKAAKATAFVEQDAPEAPEAFSSKPYQGSGAKGGVIGMLEVIESDFARLEGDTMAAEAAGKKEYDTFMKDSKKDKFAKTADMDHKVSKEQFQSVTMVSKKKDLESTQHELDAALTYYEKLKPSCIDPGTSHEERVSRRKEEIESLQNALQVLNGETV